MAMTSYTTKKKKEEMPGIIRQYENVPTQSGTSTQQLVNNAAQQYQDYLKASKSVAPNLNTAAKQQQLNSYLAGLQRGQMGANKYQGAYENAFNALTNRDKFNYSQANDPLYQQYEDMYTRNAKLAMQDTVGQISALTGGYGNSYAETAGQAMYNQAMAGLNEKALDLYNAAMDRYNMEGQQLAQNYNAAAQMYGNEQNRLAEQAYFTEQQYQTDAQRAMAMYQDELDRAAWEWSANEQQRQADLAAQYQLAQMRQADYQFDVGQQNWRETMDWNKETDTRNFNEQVRQFNQEQENWQKQFDSNEYWNQYGYDFQDKWNQQEMDYNRWATEFGAQHDKEMLALEQEYNEKMQNAKNEAEAKALSQEYAYKYAALAEQRRQYDAGLAYDYYNADRDYDYKNRTLAEQQRQYNESNKLDWAELNSNNDYRDRTLAEQQRQYDQSLAYDYYKTGLDNTYRYDELNSNNDYRNRALAETERSNRASEKLSQQQINNSKKSSGGSTSTAEPTINRLAGAPTSGAASKVDSKIKSPTTWKHSNDKNFDTYQDYVSAQIQSAYEKGDIDANDVKWLLTRYNIA